VKRVTLLERGEEVASVWFETTHIQEALVPAEVVPSTVQPGGEFILVGGEV